MSDSHHHSREQALVARVRELKTDNYKLKADRCKLKASNNKLRQDVLYLEHQRMSDADPTEEPHRLRDLTVQADNLRG